MQIIMYKIVSVNAYCADFQTESACSVLHETCSAADDGSSAIWDT